MRLEIWRAGHGIVLWPLLLKRALGTSLGLSAALEAVLDIALGPIARRWRRHGLGGCEAGHVRVALVGRGLVG